jgi:hypothetical protein
MGIGVRGEEVKLYVCVSLWQVKGIVSRETCIN